MHPQTKKIVNKLKTLNIMRKFFFSLIGVLLLSTSAFGSDVLFKMVATTTSNASNTDAGADLDLDSYYYYYVGGSALVHNGQNSAAKLVDGGIARITQKEGYIKVTLPTGVTLQAGDEIKYTGNDDESTKNILLHKLGSDAAGGRSGAVKVDHNTAYTLKNSDVVVGEHEFYINYGQSVSSPNYVKNFTISRPNANVKFYSFDEEEVRDFTTTDKVDLGNGLQVNSDGASTYNGIKSVSGKPQALYLKGKNANRAAELTVSDASTVEVWGWAGNNTYALYIAKGTYSDPSSASAVKVIELSEANVITYSDNNSYYYNELGEKVLYITPNGGFYISAIRVTKDASNIHVLSSSKGTVSSVASYSSALWTSTTGNNVTLAYDAADVDNTIANANQGAHFTIEANKGIRLASGHKVYRVSVPSNKIIVEAYIEGFTQTSEKTDGKIRINSGSWTDGMPNYTSESAPTVLNQAINANSFTIETNSRNALVEIKLLTADLGYYPVSVSGNWVSFCAAEDVELPSGVQAYVASSKTDGEDATLYMTEVESSTIPANTGVLLYSDVDGAYNLTSTTGAPAIEGTNLLVGTVARTANPSTTSETGTTYSLYDNNGEIVFARYTGAYIPSNKAYLDLSGSGMSMAPKRFRVQVGPAQTPTGVEAVESQEPMANSQKLLINGQLVIIRDGVKYNVQGQIIK